MAQRAFGWIKDPYDAAEERYGAARAGTAPARLDLTKLAPSVRDQGMLEDCVGYGLAAAAYGRQVHEGLSPIYPSPGFIWYNARQRWGDEKLNVGTYPRTGVQVLNDLGLPAEEHWPCRDLPFKFAERPAHVAYKEGYDARFEIAHVKVDAERAAVTSAMAAYGPGAFGMAVHEGFTELGPHSLVTSHVGDFKGNHYMALFGYDEQGVDVQNSWGAYWGNSGWCRLSWDLFLREAGDIVFFKRMPRIE